MIELIVAMAIKFWMWTILIAFILIGWGINFFDKRRPNKLKFTYTEYPHMQPLKISTKGVGFFKGILMLLNNSQKNEWREIWLILMIS